MSTLRRTVTLPASLDAAIDAAVAAGVAPSASALLAAAAELYLARVSDERLAAQSALLDPATEEQMIAAVRASGRLRPSWERLADTGDST